MFLIMKNNHAPHKKSSSSVYPSPLLCVKIFFRYYKKGSKKICMDHIVYLQGNFLYDHQLYLSPNFFLHFSHSLSFISRGSEKKYSFLYFLLFRVTPRRMWFLSWPRTVLRAQKIFFSTRLFSAIRTIGGSTSKLLYFFEYCEKKIFFWSRNWKNRNWKNIENFF